MGRLRSRGAKVGATKRAATDKLGGVFLVIGTRGDRFEAALQASVKPALDEVYEQTLAGPGEDERAQAQWLTLGDFQLSDPGSVAPDKHESVLKADRKRLSGLMGRLRDASMVCIDVTGAKPDAYFVLALREALAAPKGDNPVTLALTLNADDPKPELGVIPQPIFIDDRGANADIVRGIVRGARAPAEKSLRASQVLKPPKAPSERLGPASDVIYALADNATPRVGVKSGDLRDLHKGMDDADKKRARCHVVVNSENVYMDMARVSDKSLSAALRQIGARWTGPDRETTDDAMFRDLSELMGTRAKVAPGAVFITPTRAGCVLNEQLKVDAVAHVATVQRPEINDLSNANELLPLFEPNKGFEDCGEIAKCTRNALECVERWATEEYLPKNKNAGGGENNINILFPLLAAGDGGKPSSLIAAIMVSVFRAYIEKKGAASVFDTIFLIARDEHAWDACDIALRQTGFQRAPDAGDVNGAETASQGAG